MTWGSFIFWSIIGIIAMVIICYLLSRTDADRKNLRTYKDILFDKKKFEEKNNKKGFSLLELLICLAIMGILAAIAVVCYAPFIEKVRDL